MLTPAMHDALNQFFLQVLGGLGIVLAGLAVLAKAYIDRRAHKLKVEDDESLKDREQKRQLELEQMRQETAKAQADAAEAKATGEILTNLTHALLQHTQSSAAEAHATREAITNQAQSIGDLEQSIDRIAGAVVDNTTSQRRSIQVIDVLNQKLLVVFPTDNSLDELFEQMKMEIIKAIRDICKDKPPPPPATVNNTISLGKEPEELPKAAGL